MQMANLAALLILIAAAGGGYGFAVRERGRLALGLWTVGPLLAITPFLITPALRDREPSAAPAHAMHGTSTGAATAAASASVPMSPGESTVTRTVAPLSGARPSVQLHNEERAVAEQLRVAGKYSQARDAFRQLAQHDPNNADAWADAADCAAAAAGGNLDASADDIERALTAQPMHPKALWLKASLKLQHKDYPAAAALWSQLLSVLPPDSEDRREVQANLDEARMLMSKPTA